MQAFYSQSVGAVLSTSINRYMYISSHRFFEPDKIRTKYSITETVNSVSDLKHPILREVLKMLEIEGGIEISSIADVPSGTGMGSSSSFTVGLLHNLLAYKNRFASKEALAALACEVEIERLGEPIGKQDQYAAAYGGLNVFEFYADGSVSAIPLHPKPEILEVLQRRLLMFYVGNARKAGDILEEQKRNVSQADKFMGMKQMVALVYGLRDALYAEDLDAFGTLLHENWMIKRSLASGISNGLIDEAYEVALRKGALGGKLLGAGGGGFMLFYCHEMHQQGLIDALGHLRLFPFAFDRDGSKIIHYGDY